MFIFIYLFLVLLYLLGLLINLRSSLIVGIHSCVFPNRNGMLLINGSQICNACSKFFKVHFSGLENVLLFLTCSEFCILFLFFNDRVLPILSAYIKIITFFFSVHQLMQIILAYFLMLNYSYISEVKPTCSSF